MQVNSKLSPSVIEFDRETVLNFTTEGVNQFVKSSIQVRPIATATNKIIIHELSPINDSSPVKTPW